jgi:hypothetical protein
MTIEVSPLKVDGAPEHLLPIKVSGDISTSIVEGFILRFEDLCVSAGANGVEVKRKEIKGENTSFVLSITGLTDEQFNTFVMSPLRRIAEFYRAEKNRLDD